MSDGSASTAGGTHPVAFRHLRGAMPGNIDDRLQRLVTLTKRG